MLLHFTSLQNYLAQKILHGTRKKIGLFLERVSFIELDQMKSQKRDICFFHTFKNKKKQANIIFDLFSGKHTCPLVVK